MVLEPGFKHRKSGSGVRAYGSKQTILGEIGERIGRIENPTHYALSSGTCKEKWNTTVWSKHCFLKQAFTWLLKTQTLLGPTCRVSDPTGLVWGLRMCIYNKFPNDADAAGLGITHQEKVELALTDNLLYARH